MDIVEDVMCSHFLTSGSAQFYNHYIQVSLMLIGYEKVLDLLESLNDEGAGAKNLSMFHLDHIESIRETAEEPPIFFRVTRNFVKSSNEPAPHLPAF